VCYWPGQGKKGQFPSNFGKRGGFKRLATNTCQGSTKLSSTINIVSTSKDNDQVFAYMTMGDAEFTVSAISTSNDNYTPDDKPPPSFSDSNQ